MKTRFALILSASFLTPLAHAQDYYLAEAETQKHQKPILELGIMNGLTKSVRSATISSPFGTTADGTHKQNLYAAGLQLKIFFNPLVDLQTFFYANGQGMFSSSNNLINTPVLIFFNNSTAQLETNYVVRMGVGLDSDPFGNFTVTIGGGFAVVNQTLSSNVVEFTTTGNSKEKNSFIPSIMGSINYKFCDNCLYKHPLLASVELSADDYPNLSFNTVGTFGTYRTNVRSAWQYHLDLVMSTHF